jgi:multidrug resistance efflux pump
VTFKEIVDAVSALGTLGFALLAVYAFLTEKVVPRSRLDEQRADKKEAMDLARASVAQQERLATAVEERNRLEAAREQAEAAVRRRA